MKSNAKKIFGTFMKQIISLCVLLLVSLTLMNCESPIDGNSPQKGDLQILINDNVSRTILPDISMDPAYYHVQGNGPNGSYVNEKATGNIILSKLAFGLWNIHITAYNDADTAIGEGSADVTVVSNRAVTSSITVSPYEGYGNLSLTVKWPENSLQNPRLSGTLTSASGTNRSVGFRIEGNIATYSITYLQSGYYTLALNLTDNGYTVIGAVEVVRVVTGNKTDGLIEFADLNPSTGNVQVNIDVQMGEPLELAISGSAASIYEGESLSLSASTLNFSGAVSYVWYINGKSAATGNAYTIGTDLKPGQYRIDVTGFSADGKRAGSTTAVFEVQSTPVFEIRNHTDLNNVRNNLDAEYIIVNDIDLREYIEGSGWTPIGTESAPFNGTLNGNNKTIYSLIVNNPSLDIAGLFGVIGETAQIKDLTVSAVSITAGSLAAPIAGINKGTITNVSCSGTVVGHEKIAGFTGNNLGTISNSSSTCSVNVSHNQAVYSGYTGSAAGFTAYNSGTLEHCSASGAVTTDGNYPGGLVSQNSGLIRYSCATGDVSSTGTGNETGGLVSRASSKSIIEFSYATGNVSAKGNFAGGLMGVNSGGIVRFCYASGNVESTAAMVGGLIGRIQGDGLLENCYATGNLQGFGNIGSLIGDNQASRVRNSYGSGSITSGGATGGISGVNMHSFEDENASIDNCVSLAVQITGTFEGNTVFGTAIGDNYEGHASYFPGAYSNLYVRDDIVITGFSMASATGVHAQALPLSVFESQAIYENPVPATAAEPDGLGWDFTTVWKMDPAISPYPVLQWQ